MYALRELTNQQPADDSYETWLAISEKRKASTNEEDKKEQDENGNEQEVAPAPLAIFDQE